MGGREIGFLFGQYKRLRNEFTGVLTGKGLNWGGSLIRPEATGYGCVYFAAEMLKTRKDSLEGKLCLVSGSGNVSQYTVEKLLDLGAKPITLSDSNGVIFDPDGIDREKLAWVMELKNVRRGRIREYADQFKKAVFMPTDMKLGSQPAVEHQGRLRVPERHAKRNQRQGRSEPDQERRQASWPKARTCRARWKRPRCSWSTSILYGPAKAANAGGVATSGLEMAQNSARLDAGRAKKSMIGCTRS